MESSFRWAKINNLSYFKRVQIKPYRSMSKLVRRSHFDLFLRFRSNHLQYRIRPGNFWNDVVSVNSFMPCFLNEKSNRRNYFRFCTNTSSVIFGNRRLSRRTADSLPSFPRTNIGSCTKMADLYSSCHWLQESFHFYSGNRDSPTSGSRWNVGGTMATRNLTEIYINLRTEITRFKAYSLGDSVRSDSPGVL